MDAIVEKSPLKTTPIHPVFVAEVSGVNLRKLTQADADARIADATAAITEFVNNTQEEIGRAHV